MEGEKLRYENPLHQLDAGQTDVVITSPADNEVLAYDSATGNWINQTAAETGLGDVTTASNITANNVVTGDDGAKGVKDSGYSITETLAASKLLGLDDSCVLNLSGQEGTGATISDISGNGNDGTITGATWVGLPSGTIGLNYDGISFINLGTDAEYPLATQSFSVFAWINTSTSDRGQIITRHGTGAYSWFLEVRATDYYPRFLIYTSGGVAHCTVSGTANIADGSWHFVVGTWEVGVACKIYVDGELINTSASFTDTPSATNTALRIGTGDAASFIGKIFEPNVFIGVLSATDVEYLYHTSKHKYQTHGTLHQSGGIDAVKLDDLSAPDDNTDLNASTTKHGLMPKGTGTANNYFKSDNSQGALHAATDSLAGAVELATIAETNTGTDATRAVTPDGLAGSNLGRRVVVVDVIAQDASLTTGDGAWSFRVPDELNGMNLVHVWIKVFTAGSSGTVSVALYNLTDSQDMLSVNATIDQGETDSKDAGTAYTINTSYDDVATGDVIRVDVDGNGTDAQGLQLGMSFQLP